MIHIPNPIPYLNSICSDLQIKGQAKINGWHKHIPIGIGLWGLLFYLSTFVFRNEEILWFQLFVVSTLEYAGCVLFEWGQQGSRFIDEKERFESNKDALVGSPVVMIVVCIMLLFRKFK